jgi:hypothetical protein
MHFRIASVCFFSFHSRGSAPIIGSLRLLGHLKAVWRYMQAHDLRPDEMARLERTAPALGNEAWAKILI